MAQEIPNFANFNVPSNDPNNNSENPNIPNQNNNVSAQEKQKSWGNAVIRSQTTKKGAKTIRSVRANFQNFLQQNGMDLLTSAVEFGACGDFIKSSYVIYKNHGDHRVPLDNFLNQYPQFGEICAQIRDYLKNVQNQIQVNSQNYNPNYNSNNQKLGQNLGQNF